MGYIDQLMGRNEEMRFVTREHWIVLLSRTLALLFTFIVFLALGFLIRGGNTKTVQVLGFGVLLIVPLPLYQIVAPIVQGKRRGELFRKIWKPVLIAVLILIISLALLLVPTTWPTVVVIALAISFFPLANTVRIYLDWYNERYAITNRRVMLIKGIINKHVSDSALEKVNDVVLVQSVIGGLLGYGDVEIITGSDIGVNLFQRIAQPGAFKGEMLHQKEGLGTTNADRHEDVPELLAQLDNLRRQGILTDEEFEAKKQQLLDQI